MGSWGYRTFEDDTALDWIGNFKEQMTPNKLEQTLEEALQASFIDDLIGSGALAAAEVVAALNGKPSELLQEEVSRWAELQSPSHPNLLTKASKAVSKVFDSSELREIWEDSGSLDKWRLSIDDLLSRLKPI